MRKGRSSLGEKEREEEEEEELGPKEMNPNPLVSSFLSLFSPFLFVTPFTSFPLLFLNAHHDTDIIHNFIPGEREEEEEAEEEKYIHLFESRALALPGAGRMGGDLRPKRSLAWVEPRSGQCRYYWVGKAGEGLQRNQFLHPLEYSAFQLDFRPPGSRGRGRAVDKRYIELLIP